MIVAVVLVVMITTVVAVPPVADKYLWYQL